MKIVGNLYKILEKDGVHLIKCTFFDEQSSNEIWGDRWGGIDLGIYTEKGFIPNKDLPKYPCTIPKE